MSAKEKDLFKNERERPLRNELTSLLASSVQAMRESHARHTLVHEDLPDGEQE